MENLVENLDVLDSLLKKLIPPGDSQLGQYLFISNSADNSREQSYQMIIDHFKSRAGRSADIASEYQQITTEGNNMQFTHMRNSGVQSSSFQELESNLRMLREQQGTNHQATEEKKFCTPGRRF